MFVSTFDIVITDILNIIVYNHFVSTRSFLRPFFKDYLNSIYHFCYSIIFPASLFTLMNDTIEKSV